MALTGIRVPRSTGEPLCTPGLTSTSGHSDQSIVSMFTIESPRTLFLPRTCIVTRARTCFKRVPWETTERGRRRSAPASDGGISQADAEQPKRGTHEPHGGESIYSLTEDRVGRR